MFRKSIAKPSNIPSIIVSSFPYTAGSVNTFSENL